MDNDEQLSDAELGQIYGDMQIHSSAVEEYTDAWYVLMCGNTFWHELRKDRAALAAAHAENVLLRRANEGLERLEGLPQYSTDELLDELERRSAPFRETQSEADLVRNNATLRAALAAAHAEAARLRLALLPFASQWTETLDAVFREISPQVEVRCDATVAMMRNAAAALAPPPAAPQDK